MKRTITFTEKDFEIDGCKNQKFAKVLKRQLAKSLNNDNTFQAVYRRKLDELIKDIVFGKHQNRRHLR